MSSSIIGPIVEAIQVPFPELERILIESRDCTGTPVLSTLLGGSAPRLKEIRLHGVVVPFPALRQLLLSTINLTSLCLENITSAGYFSPDALITVLLHPALAQLRILELHFRLSAFCTTTSSARPPPLTRATLSSLTSLCYRGIPDYLEEFVAKIDTPALMTIRIIFYNQLIFNVQEICKFLSRMDRSEFVHEVVLRPFLHAVCISLSHQKRGSRSWECDLGILCRQLEWQLSSATQILSQLSTFLPKMYKLNINTLRSAPAPKEDVDLTQWLELFQLFPDLVSLSVSELFVPGITHALVTEDMATEALPTLRTLTLRGYRESPSVAEAAEKFAAMRKLSGHQLTLLG
ncbi:hypothetical protein BC827DRAFT_1266423 [Russula dissimulans]|nr:hypothetical protein BC827DRAFT_1266423 [Russula dissimulans]